MTEGKAVGGDGGEGRREMLQAGRRSGSSGAALTQEEREKWGCSDSGRAEVRKCVHGGDRKEKERGGREGRSWDDSVRREGGGWREREGGRGEDPVFAQCGCIRWGRDLSLGSRSDRSFKGRDLSLGHARGATGP
jgi:hypothetical protein